MPAAAGRADEQQAQGVQLMFVLGLTLLVTVLGAIGVVGWREDRRG